MLILSIHNELTFEYVEFSSVTLMAKPVIIDDVPSAKLIMHYALRSRKIL